MTLAASGEMSLGGTATNRSVAVELGLSATGQISLNDAGVRNLAGVSSGAINLSTDFYGKTASNGYLPTTLTGNDNATDTSIPGQIGSANDNTLITGTTYWRRVTITNTTAGTKRLYVRNTHTSFRGDVQVNMFSVTQSGTTTDVAVVSGTTVNTSFQTAPRTTSSSAFPSTGWTAITAVTSNGLFLAKTTNTPTGSSGTGRLSNFIDSNSGYGYFETTGPNTSVNNYSFMRTPAYSLSVGDTVDLYYGVDASNTTEIYFELAA